MVVMTHNFGLNVLLGGGVGVEGTWQHISGTGAHSHLVRTGSGLNCSFDYFLFFEGPKGRYGPREAWAHMGWVGHPAH